MSSSDFHSSELTANYGPDISQHSATVLFPEFSEQTVFLREKIADWAFNHAVVPPRPIAILSLGRWTLSTAGNITTVQGPVKVGKSAVLAAIIAAYFKGGGFGADCLGFSAHNREGKAVIHIDTEQSKYDHDALIRRAMRRVGVESPPPWFYSYCLTPFDVAERLEVLDLLIQDANAAHGGVFCIIIDGVADLCTSPNDEKEAFELVAKLASIATVHECAVIAVIHENPGSLFAKMRGHLGSQLERKAETPLRLAKDSYGITTMWSEKCRHNYIPANQGVCFKWSDEAKMHIGCESSSEIKAEAKRSKFIEEAVGAFNESGKLTYTELVARIIEVTDLAKKTAENRVKTYAAEGIIVKSGDGTYSISDSLPLALKLPAKNPHEGCVDELPSNPHPLIGG